MKKAKLLSALTAAAMLASGIGTFSVSAEVNAADYPTYMDDAYADDLQGALEAYFSLGVFCQLSGDVSDYTYSNLILCYDLQMMNQLDPRDGFVLVGKDGEWIGYMRIQAEKDENGEYYSHFIPTFEENVIPALADAVDNGKNFIIGDGCGDDCLYYINGMMRNVLYVDGVSYDLSTGEVLGGSPETLEYIPFGSGAEDGATIYYTETTEAAAVGDINLDGRVDITDAVLLSQGVSGAVQLSTQQQANADCDGNGAVDVSDATTLMQFLVHAVDTLPPTATE